MKKGLNDAMNWAYDRMKAIAVDGVEDVRRVGNSAAPLFVAALLASCDGDPKQPLPAPPARPVSPVVQPAPVPPQPETFYASQERKNGIVVLKQAVTELRKLTKPEEFANYTGLQSVPGWGMATPEFDLSVGPKSIRCRQLDSSKKRNNLLVEFIYDRDSDMIRISENGGYRTDHAYDIPADCREGDTVCLEYRQVAEDFKAAARSVYPLFDQAMPLLQTQIDAESAQIVKEKVPGYLGTAQGLMKEAPAALDYCVWTFNYHVKGEWYRTVPYPDGNGSHGEMPVTFSHNPADSCNSADWEMRFSTVDEASVSITAPVVCNPTGKTLTMEIHTNGRGDLTVPFDVTTRTEENAAAYDLYISPRSESWRTEALKRQTKLQACEEGP